MLTSNTFQMSAGDIYMHRRHKMKTNVPQIEPKEDPWKIQQKERFSVTQGLGAGPQGRQQLYWVLKGE